MGYRVLFVIFFLLPVGGCGVIRRATLGAVGTGHDEIHYHMLLGEPDLKMRLSEYVQMVPDYPAEYGVGGLFFNRHRDFESYELWRGINDDAKITDFEKDWLDKFPYKDAIFWFYDSRPRSHRSVSTTTHCYIFGFRNNKCIMKAHFPWRMSNLESSSREKTLH